MRRLDQNSGSIESRTARRGSDAFSFIYSLISPVRILTATWLVSASVYVYLTKLRGDMPYFEYLVSAENLRDESSFLSYAILGINFGLFVLGAKMFDLSAPARGVGGGVGRDEASYSPDIRRLVLFSCFTMAVALLWVGGAIMTVGGVAQLADLAASENMAARDVLRNASFPGGRLISFGFIGLATISAAYVVHAKAANQRRVLTGILIVSLTYLGVMPLLMSGRITFFVACIGSYIAATLSARRLIGLRYLTIGVPILLGVWTAKQYITLGHLAAAQTSSVSDQAIDGLLFYIYNDFLNAVNAPELLDGAMTFGWFSFRFVFFFTFTDKIFYNFIDESMLSVGQWRTAGEVPFLMAPFVDFWLFGSLVLVIFGVFCQLAYRRSMFSVRWASIYGLLCGGLIMTTHSSFITSQELVYSLLIVYIVSRPSGMASVVRPAPRRHLFRSR
ncbi:oligosaccharide repeat unit polymerase [Xanthobacter flavus]|uniref:oligosaccharide repeat unit polymerase n=1 Tax=Xanthobacter flavus TaxID=281 RepID=UPI001AE9B77F|nr:oligosaccharide repeat unit polymerase [Xanthobacter flavus]MBP2151639.1 hypothetical protein [Xanthobacter flavus]